MGILGDVVSSAAKAAGKAMDRAEKRNKSAQDCEQWIQASIQEEKEVEECYEVFVKNRKMQFADMEESSTIQDLFKQAVSVGSIERDYSILDRLPEKYRKSQTFIDNLETVKTISYQQCVDAYLNYDKSVYYTMLMLKPLLYFDEIRDEIDYSLKHLPYYEQVNNDIKSVLTEYMNIGEAFEEIKNYKADTISFDEFNELVDGYYSISNLFDEGKYQDAFNIITKASFERDIFDFAKKSLLQFALLLNNESSESTKAYEQMKEVVDGLFRASRLVHREGSEYKYDFVRIPVVDMIVAESIRFNHVGMIDKINDQLKDLLNDFILNRDEMDAEQFSVLQRVFAYLKAYEQEKIVLEFMVLNNIPRNEAQEKRLLFLKNTGGMSGGFGNVNIPEEIYVDEPEKLTFDYRCISWGESQIKGYLNYFSGENRRMMLPVVVDDWNNNLEIKGIKWSLNDLLRSLNCGLKDNFGDKYQVEVVESGALAEGWIDYSDSILVKEDANFSNRYPWLQFVISAEQLTLSQISFSIFVLYHPEYDFVNDTDCVKVNSAMINKLVALKLKQNPKLNNYINVTKSVIISELEKYLNGTTISEDIY